MTVDNKILNELKKRKSWVSTTRLGRVSGSFAVHSAISRLRKKGWKITCELENLNPEKKAWYILNK